MPISASTKATLFEKLSYAFVTELHGPNYFDEHMEAAESATKAMMRFIDDKELQRFSDALDDESNGKRKVSYLKEASIFCINEEREGNMLRPITIM